MGVNRYDRPAQAQFINTYVPIPWEQMMQAGQMKQDRFDQSVQAMDEAVTRAENLNAIAGSVDAKKRDALIDKLYGIRDTYAGKDLSDPMVVRQLNNEIYAAAKPSEIRQWEDSYQAWARNTANKQKLILENRYNPLLDKDPAAGWDSSTMGVYNYSDRAYLGKEATLATYFDELARHGRVLGTTAEGYTKIGRTEADINKIIEGTANQYAATTSGQDEINIFKQQHPELAAQLGDDTNIAKYIMKDFGQKYIWSDIRGSRYPTGGSGGSDSLGMFPFAGTKDKQGEVTNMSVKDIRKERSQKRKAYIDAKKKYDLAVEQNTSEEKLAGLRATMINAQESHEEFEYKYQRAVDTVNEKFSDHFEYWEDQYAPYLVKFGGRTDEEAREILRIAREISILDVPHSPISGGELRRQLKERLKDYNLTKSELRQVVQHNASIASDPNYRKQLKQAVRGDEGYEDLGFSYTETGKEVLFTNIGTKSGVAAFPGADGKMYHSVIDAGITSAVQVDPEAWEIHVDDKKLENNNDKLFDYIVESGTNPNFNFDLYSMDEVGAKDGAISLNYRLTTPNPKNENKVGERYNVQVKITDQTQILNLSRQLAMQGDSDHAGKVLFAHYAGLAEAEGPGLYSMPGDVPARVTYEDGSYSIEYQGRTLDSGLTTRRQVGAQLQNLAAALMERLQY